MSKISGLKDISHKYTTYFFDLDGVIWRGQQKIKGGIESLNFLRSQNKRMFFVTNSSIRNREMLKLRFRQFGFEANLEEIYPSDFVTTQYIKSVYPQCKKIMVVGQPSLAHQLTQTGKQIWHLNTPQSNQNNTPLGKLVEQIDPKVDMVVFGYDIRMNYYKLCLASFHIQHGAKLIGTNPDHFTMNLGYKIPGNGSMLKAVEVASGVAAEIPSKPNPFILDHLISTNNLKRQECLMIGDNLDTDILFGINGKIDTLCVLTGNSTEQMVLKSKLPTYYTQFMM